MHVLVVNAGSSTLKLRVVDDGDSIASTVDVDPWAGDDARDAFAAILADAPPVDAVGHRVVHGGRDLVAPTVVDDRVAGRIAALSPVAPLHQPRALAALATARAVLPDVPHVACFDTAFHATMPVAARTYALPETWRDRWGLTRFGFHGLSHSWAARRAAALLGGPAHRAVSCHLGAGASLCAVLDGRSVDTTMGFTPLEGLVMATRAGSVDPGLVLFLLTEGGLDVRAVAHALEHESGLAGLSGTSGDMRAVLAARAAGDDRAVLAFDVFVHRLRREIAAMTAALGGIDALVFTGGIGEHVAEVRAAAVDGLAHLGLAIDPRANAAVDGDADVTADVATARTVVVRAREELEITALVRAALSPPD